METIFNLATLVVALFWLLMLVLPHWRWTRRLLELPLADERRYGDTVIRIHEP